MIFNRFALIILTLPWASLSANEDAAGENATFIRDPFSPSRLMYEQAGALSNVDADIFGFQPAPENVDIKIPQMRLRGFITPEGAQEQLALLEITGSGVFMVREGDEINIDPRQPANAIRISEISRLSITIETGTLGRIRVLR